jgi:ketosteroid isomerase-like protein
MKRTGVDEQAVRQVLDEFSDAIWRNDTDALDRIWSDDYTVVLPTGSIIDKARRLEFVRSGGTKFDSVSRDEENIRLYGNTAVAISRTTAKGQVAGQDVNNQFRVTTVLVKKDELWQMVTQQLNIIS